jgi:uncharacterized repeat protein (TIGR01451 family)
VGAGSNNPAGVFFRMTSDWGSAFPGQEVNYTLVVRNNTNGPLNNVRLRSELPANLSVLGASSDSGQDPQVVGNTVEYSSTQLAAGSGVEVTVRTQIKPTVAIGTLLLAQGQLSYDGLAQPTFSNLVSVLVVSSQQATATNTVVASNTALPATATAGGAYPPPATASAPANTTTSVASPTVSGTSAPTVAPSATRSTTNTPVPPPTATLPPAGGGTPELPPTDAGVPLAGIILLGLTMLTRTVRLHRAKSRM